MTKNEKVGSHAWSLGREERASHCSQRRGSSYKEDSGKADYLEREQKDKLGAGIEVSPDATQLTGQEEMEVVK